MKIPDEIKKKILRFLREGDSQELFAVYFFYLEKKFNLHPVVFLPEKIIYQSSDEAIRKLEKEGKVWREAEIKIGYGPPTVNELTRKIYICPFTGKVFADNTHPNPQDAIYDWVAKCPENKEYVGGVKVKRFFISEDPEIIKNYIQPRKEPITKHVFSSAITGKLYSTKEAVISDFRASYLKPMKLIEVQNQNRYQLEESFLQFIQQYLQEDEITKFVEALAEDEQFQPYIAEWVETEET